MPAMLVAWSARRWADVHRCAQRVLFSTLPDHLERWAMTCLELLRVPSCPLSSGEGVVCLFVYYLTLRIRHWTAPCHLCIERLIHATSNEQALRAAAPVVCYFPRAPGIAAA